MHALSTMVVFLYLPFRSINISMLLFFLKDRFCGSNIISNTMYSLDPVLGCQIRVSYKVLWKFHFSSRYPTFLGAPCENSNTLAIGTLTSIAYIYPTFFRLPVFAFIRHGLLRFTTHRATCYYIYTPRKFENVGNPVVSCLQHSLDIPAYCISS